MNDKKQPFPDCPNPSTVTVSGEADSAFELVNRYGTYEIQPTSDSAHKYPAIHQGLPRQWRGQREGKQALFPETDA